MAKSSLRIINWKKLVEDTYISVFTVVFGIVALSMWMAGKLMTDWVLIEWVQPIVGAFFVLLGISKGYWTARYSAVYVAFGEQFRYRKLFGGGRRKWSNVKRVKLVWEISDVGERLWRTVEIYLVNSEKIIVGIDAAQVDQVRQVLQARTHGTGVQITDDLE